MANLMKWRNKQEVPASISHHNDKQVSVFDKEEMLKMVFRANEALGKIILFIICSEKREIAFFYNF